MIAGMKTWRTLALAVLPLALLAGCTGGSPGPSLEPSQNFGATSSAGSTGSTTRLPTSPSPSGVVVPDLRGLDTRHADQLLEAYGLKLSVNPIGGKTNKVVAQRPEVGTVVPLLTVVTVQARCFAAPCPFPGTGKQIYDPCTCAAA